MGYVHIIFNSAEHRSAPNALKCTESSQVHRMLSIAPNAPNFNNLFSFVRDLIAELLTDTRALACPRYESARSH